jgi:hypothetical protein
MRTAAIALAMLALSSCATWQRMTPPGVRVARAGGCDFYFATSGLFWQPLQEIAVCPNDTRLVYLTGTAKESNATSMLGPLGTAASVVNPTMPLR